MMNVGIGIPARTYDSLSAKNLNVLMAAYDFSSHRLFVEAKLCQDAETPLDRAQTNYLCNVLRLGEGAEILIFNGRDGEWRARLGQSGRKSFFLRAQEMVRDQGTAFDLQYVFAPLKHARLDYLIQKAVEMGVSHIQPILTRRTQVDRINGERMRANAIEAAEQCGILNLPEIAPVQRFDAFLNGFASHRWLIFCDEDAKLCNPLEALEAVATKDMSAFSVLVGPEGGFDPNERERLLAMPQVIGLSLGPRILRADTAAVAVLALIQAKLGDWRA
jgi:16S rRNA (uracil1498-N3)-methyltransferase